MSRSVTLRPRHAARAAALALAILAPVSLWSAGCRTSPVLKGGGVRVIEEGPLASANPADIAVAPVAVVVPGTRVPSEALRRSAQAALVKRRYSPLALERVDENLAGTQPASYRGGALREDAVLELIVHSWDDSLWSLRSVLSVDLEARLVDPDATAESPLGATLWAGRLTRRFDFTALGQRSSTELNAVQGACDVVLEELLSKLPARDPLPGAPAGE